MESQPSVPNLTDIDRLKKALRLPLETTSTCLAITGNNRQCKKFIVYKDKIDPILTSLLLKPVPNTTPPLSSSSTDKLLSLLIKHCTCHRHHEHRNNSENIVSLDALRDLFHKWKQLEENGRTNDEASTTGTDGYQESQTCALSEGCQRKTGHETTFDDDGDNKNDEDGDEAHTNPHSDQSNEHQPSEHQIDEHSKGNGRANYELDGTEVRKSELRRNPVRRVRSQRENMLHATKDQAPTTLTTPPRTTNNSSKSEADSKDETFSRSEASTPIPITFSPPEPSFADTPDTEITTSPTGRQDMDGYFDSPSGNRGSSARSGEGLSIPPPKPSLLQPKMPEPLNEERPTTPSNSKNQESAGRGSTRRGRSVSTDKASARTPLHPSRTLTDGTKTAEIWEISAKSNALNDILTTMRTVAKGDYSVPGHVYAFKYKSVPGHIKIGFATNKGGSSEKSHVVLHPVGEHKDLHVWKRLKDQEDKCMDGMEILFAVYMSCAAGQMERLVHHTLYEEKRIAHCQNTACCTKHKEWFVVDKERAFEVISRWAEFSRLFPYNEIGSLGGSWHDHAYKYIKLSSSMTLNEWWNGPWNDFKEAQEIQHDQQLAAALEEKRISQQEETSLLDAQLELQLERNRLQQEKNELKQCATRLREEKVKRDLDRTRDRQQELQEQIERMSLS